MYGLFLKNYESRNELNLSINLHDRPITYVLNIPIIPALMVSIVLFIFMQYGRKIDDVTPSKINYQ